MRFKRDTDLQTMCLQVVAAKINTFSTPSAANEVYIEVLRRRYSDRLFELLEKKCNSKIYLVWLLSPHWKNVSLPGRGFSYSDILLKFKSFGSKITSLSLEDSGCSTDILSAMICCLPNITLLNLSGTLFREETLLLIRKMCPNLNALNLSNCHALTDDGLKNLCYLKKNEPTDFPSLKVLNISNTFVQLQSIVFVLKHLKSIQILNHGSLTSFLYSVHKPDLCYQIGKIVKYNITYFEYRTSYMRTTHNLRSVLEVFSVICPHINDVYIQDEMSKSKLKLLTNFEGLKKLKILNMVHYSKALTFNSSISPFLTLKGSLLTDLELIQLSVSANVIANSCPNLKNLVLCGVAFEDFKSFDVNTKIPALKRLEALTIKHLSLNEDRSLKSIDLLISSSGNLNHLFIQYAKNFTDTVADVILKLSNLLTVDFSFTDIKPGTLMRFFTHPAIIRICTDGCPRISINDRSSFISKLVNDGGYRNSCSWEIDYSELKHEWNP